MTILKNETIDYLSINLTEDETQWVVGNTYDYADEVRDGHFIYKYAGTDGTNTELSPSTDTTDKWVYTKPTNYYSMLDGKTESQTSKNEELVFSFSWINYRSLSLLNIEGKSINIEMINLDDDSVVYSESLDLIDDFNIIDFYSYCFEDYLFTENIYRDLPIYPNAKVTVTITSIGGSAKIGRLVTGRPFWIGHTGYGANLGLSSYSRKTTNEFGITDLIHRGAVNEDSYEVSVPTPKIPSIRRKLIEMDATPILFIMDEREETKVEHLLIFGYWEDVSILLANSTTSTTSITIKGIL